MEFNLTLVSLGFAALSVAGSAGTGVYYINHLNDTLAGQSKRLVEIQKKQEVIRSDQGNIRKEQATQTGQLREIRDEQGEIESRQRWLASEVNRATGNLAINIGRLMERTAGP